MNLLIRSKQGSALLIVLAVLVLLTVAGVGFFSRTISLRKSASGELSAAITQTLADTVVSLVQAQIDQATTMGSAGTAWASQPGAIRVFDSSGDLERIYKLYSSTAMTTSDPATMAGDLPDSAGWATEPALWVDLNAPATIGSGANEIKRFPILDYPGNGQIEGFDISGAPGAPAGQPAPMPVRWLYVLEDGQLIAPTSSGSSTVTVGGATAANPIIGRVAFWSDDETCKVNINTAGGSALGANGTFWDTPRFELKDEKALALNQPGSGEYQRYPGHPATTTLSKVFPTLTTAKLLALTPRYRFGGSSDAAQMGANVTPKKERKYTSVGELLYNDERAASGLEAQQLENARFLLTAHSRAPEVTLFGTPRVNIWPVSADSSKRTATDRLLSFASRINGRDYGFVRADPGNTTTDISIPRNDLLLSYLDTLTSRVIPGFGGSFSNKYPQDRRDVLVKIFDYVRCTNLSDSTPTANKFADKGVVVPAKHLDWEVQGFGRFPVVSEVSLFFIALGDDGEPVHPSQAGAKFGTGNPTYWSSADQPAAGRVAIQAYLLISLFDPSHGFREITDSDPVIRVTGLETLQLTCEGETFPLGFPAAAVLRPPLTPDRVQLAGGRMGGAQGFRRLVGTSGATSLRLGSNPTTFPATASPNNPFYSSILPIKIPVSAQMEISGGAGVRVELYGINAGGFTDAQRAAAFDIDLTKLETTPLPIPKLVGETPNTKTANTFGLTNNSAIKETARDRAHFMNFSGGAKLSQAVSATNDVLWSLILNPAAGPAGDARALSRSDAIASDAFVPHPQAVAGSRMASSAPFSQFSLPTSVQGGKLFKDANYQWNTNSTNWVRSTFPTVPTGLNGAFAANDGVTPGDWDNGVSMMPDGPYINKADEGSLQSAGQDPYFNQGQTEIEDSLFSPNRMVPSAGMFGSLPTGVISGRPWQTLLFRPGPTGHIGSTSPRDHLLVDLFWMPVAEPYAISEPFSTDGKVNLNYQIQPFTYIKRNTALRSALASEKVTKVPLSKAGVYKTQGNRDTDATASRFALNLDESSGTLRQFEEKFASGGLFKSATEICDIFLVPQGSSWATDAAARAAWYGNDFALVGDNTRERPYANLLGRLTTKSNTFTVYYTVQALKSPPSVPAGTWNEERGVILSEYRGSTTIERYLDPNDATIPDYAADLPKIDSDPLDRHYNWRVLQNSRFAP
jgi:uncharacterized protein (TIGR02600 family)